MAFENMVENKSRRISGVEILEDFFNGELPEEHLAPAIPFKSGAVAHRVSIQTDGFPATAVAVRGEGGRWYVTHNTEDTQPFKISDEMILHPSSRWELLYLG